MLQAIEDLWSPIGDIDQTWLSCFMLETSRSVRVIPIVFR